MSGLLGTMRLDISSKTVHFRGRINLISANFRDIVRVLTSFRISCKRAAQELVDFIVSCDGRTLANIYKETFDSVKSARFDGDCEVDGDTVCALIVENKEGVEYPDA